MGDLAAARAGDEAAFERLVGPLPARALAHCYRMVGSVQDAEDLVQESLVRAWRGLDGFDGRGPIRPWLYRIATNRSLTAARAAAGAGSCRPTSRPGPSRSGWSRGSSRPGPGREASELAGAGGVELAFVAALQHLPPRQRAVLLLCEVLAFPAREVAALLDTTTASVNSALQRARRRLGDCPAPQPAAGAGRPGGPRARRRYAAAWEAGDVDAIVAMLAADARYAMPPLPEWYAGPDGDPRLPHRRAAADRWRFLPTRANGQLAFGTYLWADGAWTCGRARRAHPARRRGGRGRLVPGREVRADRSALPMILATPGGLYRA